MAKELIYLDYAATTPLAPGVAEAVARACDQFGNPSSVHRAGRAARDAISAVRNRLAETLDVGAGQVIFTSGGTEANALAQAQVEEGNRFCSAIEHEAVLSWVPAQNQLPVTPAGVLDLEAAQARLAAAPPGLVSLMAVNNATGAIQPVRDLTEIAKAHGHLVHCDAVQAFGKIPLSLNEMGADFLSISAHKIGGPKGVGALIVRDGYPLQSLLRGGGQERRRRPGTENVMGILGLGAALETMGAYANVPAFDAQIVAHVGAENVAAFDAPRVPHILSVRMPGVKSQLQLMRFDLEGICVSAGSACSSGKVAGNHVLEAMGLGSNGEEFVRVSYGPGTLPSDIDQFLSVWDKVRQSQKVAA